MTVIHLPSIDGMIVSPMPLLVTIFTSLGPMQVCRTPTLIRTEINNLINNEPDHWYTGIPTRQVCAVKAEILKRFDLQKKPKWIR